MAQLQRPLQLLFVHPSQDLPVEAEAVFDVSNTKPPNRRTEARTSTRLNMDSSAPIVGLDCEASR